MIILYTVLIVFIVYPIIGTLLFALVESLATSIKIKILVMTFGHPLLTAGIIWFACSAFNKEIAETGVLFVAGSLLRTPFSGRKYFLNLVNKPGIVTVEYYTELLQRKTVSLSTTEITEFMQSASRRLIDKTSELRVTIADETLEFIILDKATKISL